MFWPYFQTSAIHATVACGLVNATTIASLVLTPQFGYVSGPGVVGNLMASASLTLGISSELPVLKPPPRNFFIRRTNLSSLSSESLSGSSPPSPQSPFPFLTFFLSFLGRSGPIEGEGGGGGFHHHFHRFPSIRSSSTFVAWITATATIASGNIILIIRHVTTR